MGRLLKRKTGKSHLMEKVIVVDEQDHVIGTMDKMEAHFSGTLHRAFSILIFSSKEEVLLQKRFKGKYHSGGLWTNAGCSHPGPNESTDEATRKRLKHEMGIDLQPDFVYKFIYQSKLDKGLTEHDLDYVYIGIFDGVPVINHEEVEDWKFVNMKSLRDDLEQHPEQYTVWFKLIMNHAELKSA